MKIIGIIVILLSILFFQCDYQGRSKGAKDQYDKIMQIHDEVMPRMGDLRKLRKKLLKLERKDEMDRKELIMELDMAHESMMDWMAQFKIPKGIDEQTEILFLEEQMKSVMEMSDKIYNAIDHAELELKNYE